MKHGRVRSSEEELVKALTGNYRQEHLFSLKQALEDLRLFADAAEEL